MKNWVILGLLFLASGAEAQQVNLQIRPYVGIHSGGFTEKRDTIAKDVIVGYQGGFAFRVSKGKAFLEPGFGFMRTHIELSDSLIREFNDYGINDPEVRYNSFEFPVIIGYRFVSTPLFKWHVAGGFAMNVSIKSQLRDGRETILALKARDLGLRNPRFMMRLGTGIDVAFFTIDAFYSLGLNSASRTTYRTQTHGFEFNLGFLF